MIDTSLHPKCQTTLVGHQNTYQQLSQAFRKGSTHPAWIIVGDRGIGKATLAYKMAREILTNEGQDSSLVSRQIIQGTYPNFLALERCADENGKISREISVEEGRKVGTFLHQSAAIPGWRVVLIDAADEMNRNAANTLLKILEEPPAKTIFFLIVHSLGQVLPTIRSRCCKIQLFPLSDEEMAKHLGNTLSPDILSLSQGSLGRALAIHQLGGIKVVDQVIQAINGALKGNWQATQNLSATFEKDSSGYETLLDLVLWSLYRLIILTHLTSPAMPGDAKLSPLSQLKTMTHWIDAFHRVSEFLRVAKTSHLDKNHILMAIFFLIENPTAGDEFIYGQL